jgi:hypothetical protein
VLPPPRRRSIRFRARSTSRPPCAWSSALTWSAKWVASFIGPPPLRWRPNAGPLKERHAVAAQLLSTHRSIVRVSISPCRGALRRSGVQAVEHVRNVFKTREIEGRSALDRKMSRTGSEDDRRTPQKTHAK